MPNKKRMRPIWRGGISFGLIYIPVKLYSAVQTVTLDLDMLDKTDKSTIRYARINEKTGEEVPWKNIVKGYEYKEGQYVVLEEVDFDKAEQTKSKNIEIIDFVREDEIDSKFFEKPYYLEPEEGVQKTYALLREALKDEGKVGLAEFVLRNKEHLVILKPEEDVIVLNQLRYASEIRPKDELDLPSKNIKISEKELDMAKTLIAKMTESFKPKKFQDDYIDELKKVIEAKAKKKTFKVTHEVELEATNVDNLMDQLRKSLEKVNKKS